MSANVSVEVAGLNHMAVEELRARYGELFGEEPHSCNRDHLVRRVAWRLQSLAEGGLSERALRRAAELANDADLRMRPPTASRQADVQGAPQTGAANNNCPKPGAVLAREYKGRMIVVTVQPNGFEYEGTIYRSLTAVAKTVTGSHWNGRLFFGLKRNGRNE